MPISISTLGAKRCSRVSDGPGRLIEFTSHCDEQISQIKKERFMVRGVEKATRSVTDIQIMSIPSDKSHPIGTDQNASRLVNIIVMLFLTNMLLLLLA